jgi:DNA-binding SARP family transcriptional activator/TolB-like protein
MLELQLLGHADLRDADGKRRNSVLSQTKRFAFLAYLGASRGLVSRDELLAVFWAELDDERARRALNQTVYRLRGALGQDTIVSVGERELSLDRALVGCDVWEFEAALQDNRPAEAAAHYTGELLTGFHLTECHAFDDWLARRRSQLGQQAANACLEAAQEAAQRRASLDVARWARRATALSPYDEVLHRAAIRLLIDAGDRGGAASVSEALVARLRDDLEIGPAEETMRLSMSLRGGEEQGERDTPGEGADTSANAPAPVKAPSSASGPSSRPPRSRIRRSLSERVAGAALGAAVLLLAGRVGIDGPLFGGARVEPRSVAVLPFDTPGGDEADVAFAAGMHEEVLHRLQAVAGLQVTSRTSVLNIRETFGSSRDIAKALGVEFLVEGTVRRAGDQIRVTVQLIDPERDVHLSSNSWQRTVHVGAIFDIQADVALSLAAELAVELTPAERTHLGDHPTLSGPALAAWSEGSRHSEHPFDAERRREAAAAYRRALGHDPGYADAWARLARTRAMDFWLGEQEAAQEAREAFARAESLAPDRPEVQLAGGDVRYYTERDFTTALHHYERALALRPNDATALAQIGAVMTRMGDFDGGRTFIERSLELDPRSAFYVNQLALIQRDAREGESMRELAMRASVLHPGVDHYRLNALHAELCVLGDSVAARELVESVDWVSERGEVTAQAALALFRGDPEQARRLSAALSPPARVFSMHAISDAPELERAYALHTAGDTAALRAFVDSVVGQLPDPAITRSILARADQPMHPGDAMSFRGLLEAFRGRPTEARRWALAGVGVMSYREDAREHDSRRRDLLDTYVLVGDYDAALREVETLLGRPSPLGVGCLLLHPFYASLRAHPRFTEVIATTGRG